MKHTVSYPKAFEPQTNFGAMLRELLAATPLFVFIDAVRSKQQPANKACRTGIRRTA